jgi:hypothetical protein
MQQPMKLCPQCQLPAPLDAVHCGKCGHVYRTQFAPPLDRTQVVLPPTVLPPVAPTQLISTRPPGHANSPLPSVYNPAYVSPPQAWQQDEPRPHMALIIAMWASLALALIAEKVAPLLNPPLGLAALGMAIVLVCQPSKTDRVNGWVVIGLNIVGLALVVVIIMVVLGAMASGGAHRPRAM